MVQVDEPRRRRPSSEVRQLLITEASRQFTEGGYAATTMKDVSEATGVAISVLYHHFGSKADLLREAVLVPFIDVVDSLGATWASVQGRPSEEAQLVRSFISGLYQDLFRHRGALLTLVAAQSELEDDLRAEIARALRRMFLEFRAITEESRAHGWQPSDRIDAQTRFLVTFVAGTALFGQVFLPQAIEDTDRLFDDMTEFVRNGISGRGGKARAQVAQGKSDGGND